MQDMYLCCYTILAVRRLMYVFMYFDKHLADPAASFVPFTVVGRAAPPAHSPYKDVFDGSDKQGPELTLVPEVGKPARVDVQNIYAGKVRVTIGFWGRRGWGANFKPRRLLTLILMLMLMLLMQN